MAQIAGGKLVLCYPIEKLVTEYGQDKSLTIFCLCSAYTHPILRSAKYIGYASVMFRLCFGNASAMVHGCQHKFTEKSGANYEEIGEDG